MTLDGRSVHFFLINLHGINCIGMSRFNQILKEKKKNY